MGKYFDLEVFCLYDFSCEKTSYSKTLLDGRADLVTLRLTD